MRFVLLLILIKFSCFAQVKQIGQIKNEDGDPISNVVISVAKTETPESIESMMVSDDEGRFELDIESGVNYTIETKHLNYKDQRIAFSLSDQLMIVVLESSTQNLDEIVITHEKPKVTIKRDTTSFNLSKYIDSNDRKLKDLVEKLPGLTLQEDGTIYFNGEKVTKILVENEEFFGGGTKLGLDNIPADALEKLEIISNYSKSKLIKDSRRSNEQVINLVLKKDRKSILFGSAEVATDFNGFYKLHASLFQFKRKQQNNFIADGNNIAEQAIGNNESEALANINSELFNLIEVPINYNIDDNEFSKIDSKLAAANFKRIGEESTWDFLSYYNHLTDTKEISENQNYFDNESFEDRHQFENRDLNSLYFRTTNYLQNPKKERLFALAISTNKDEKLEDVQSNSNLGERAFHKNSTEKDIYITSVFEETRRINENSNIVYGAKTDLQQKDTDFSLNSNQPFLNESITWLEQTSFVLVDRLKKNLFNMELGAVYFNSINKFNTLSISPRFTYNTSSLYDEQNQLLDNGSQYNFSDLFNSTSDYRKAQMDVKMSYRYRKKSWDMLLGSTVQLFDLDVKNVSNKTNFSETVVNPFMNLTYAFNEKKRLSFDYFKRLNLPVIQQMTPYFKIEDYSAITVGNPNIENESSQNISISYFDYNIPKNYSFTSFTSIEIKEKSMATIYSFNDINRTTTYFIQNDAGYNLRSRNNFFYLFEYYSLGISFGLNHTEQKVLLTTIENSISTRISISPKFETNLKKGPNLLFSPFLAYNLQQLGSNSDRYTSTGFKSKLDYAFTNQLYIKTLYDYFQIDGKRAFDSLDFELRFSNKIKSMDLTVVGQNVFSSNTKNSVFQTTVYSSENTTKTLGRRVLLKFSYNF